MSSYADSNFITKYTTEWSGKFQQSTSMLRQACRVIPGIVGSSFVVPTFESVTATRNKARHARVAPANVQTGQVTATMQTITVGDYIDDLDMLQTNADYRAAYTEVLLSAVNKEIDTIILETLNANTTNSELSVSNTYNAAAAIAANKALTAAYVPFDEKRFALISTGALEDVLSDTKLVNRDYVASEAFSTGYMKNVLGFNHIIYPDMPTSTFTVGASVTSGKSRCFWFHQNAVVLGIGADPQLVVNPVPDSFSTFVGVKALVGCGISRPEIIQRAQIDN